MVDTSQDALVLLRTIGNQKLQSVAFRDQRPHIMAEDINFELTDDQVSGHGHSAASLVLHLFCFTGACTL